MQTAPTRVVLEVSRPPPGDGDGDSAPHQMPFRVLASAVDRVLRSTPSPVRFVWDGAEPLSAGRWFYEKAVALEQEFARPGQRLENEVVTSGALLDDPWADFLSARRFEVSLRLPGAAGAEPWEDEQAASAGALRAARRLRPRSVAFRVLAGLEHVAADPARALRSFERAGVPELSFRPAALPESGDDPLDPARAAQLLARLFDAWLELAPSRLHLPDLRDLVVLAERPQGGGPREGEALTVRVDGKVELGGGAGCCRLEELDLAALPRGASTGPKPRSGDRCHWNACCGGAGAGRALLRGLTRAACGEDCPARALLEHVRARLGGSGRRPSAHAAPAATGD
ncbi:hypothetical protein [Anaeromyxobacter paludicola]|uniref:Radical SAM protein n=1 Tax=Anaeromyxobacter paludicola TaxID=2918171 RepID=A0ABM7X6U9_9BACT|nr:hypothetical protein [Anaeromyxobacter paludicola]BDG07556.1 hypothetical protein AMPC_06690 [Anaeromyxobacter paludicola]